MNSTQDTKQIFFDHSGKRRLAFNIVFPMVLVIFILSLSFIVFYSRKVSKIDNIDNKYVVVEDKPKDIALLYTENHPSAFTIANDRIEKLRTVYIPRYLIKDDKYSTPDSYKDLLDDIRFVRKDRPGQHLEYAILSSFNFSEPPSERYATEILQKQNPQIYTDVIRVPEILKIRTDLEKNNFHGVYIDIDPLQVDSDEEAAEASNFVIAMKSILEESSLNVGVMISASNLNPYSAKLLEVVDEVYLKSDIKSGNTPQVNLLMTYEKQMPNIIILEVPTISSELDISVYQGYLKTVDYTSSEKYITKTPITGRTVEPIVIDKENIRHYITDTITTHNFLQDLNNKNFFKKTKDYQFSISDPGFEEFTTWSLIEDPINDNRNEALLTENYRESLNIETVGEGEVYTLLKTGLAGKRDIVYDESSLITQSKIVARGKPSVVEKTGKLPKKIALTFDDGPDPKTTPQVLKILDSYGVKGTFFVIGENVLQYPEIAKAIVDGGHEIENHSLSHPVFSKLDKEAQIAEIVSTNESIEAVTGTKPKYFRKPYSNFSEIDTDDSVDYLEYLTTLGLGASEYDIDSKDWLVNSPEEAYQKVVNEIENSNGDYSQILLHDTSERIENTLIALPRIIEYLQSNDIEIVRVDQLNAKTLNQSISTPETTTIYRALDLKHRILTFVIILNTIALGIAILRSSWLIFGTFLYSIKIAIKRSFLSSIDSKQRRYPHLAVIIACYNEELVIERTIRSLIDCNYPNLRIVVVDDASTDKTPKIVRGLSKKYPFVKLITIQKGGKAKALQRAIKEVRTKWLVFCDADTVFEKKALHNFADNILLKEKGLGAVAGKILVGNQLNTVTRSQVLEYGIAHLFIKPSQDVINTITVVPGAAGMWSREGLVKSGGFLHDTLAEDADATMRIIGLGERVRYNSNAVTKTEVPENLTSLFKQRTRWQLGNLQAIYKHRRGVFNHRYGTLGFIGLPLFYIDMAVTVLYPLLFPFSLYMIFASFLQGQTFNFVDIPYLDPVFVSKLGIIFITIEILFGLFVIIFQKNSILNRLKLLITLPYFLTVYKAFLSYSTIVSLNRALRGTLQGWNYLQRTANLTE